MADAYKVKADTSFPEVIREGVSVSGEVVQETMGRSFAAGDYVLASQLSDRDQHRAENGDLDHLLEAATEADYSAWAEAVGISIRIPEHEVERYIAVQDGRTVVEKDQILELRAAGAEAAATYMADQKEAGLDQRPSITEQPSFVEVPSLVEAGAEDGPGAVIPATPDADKIPDALIEQSGVELPPGHPVGPTLAKAQGADPDAVDAETEKTAPRQRPGGAPAVSATSLNSDADTPTPVSTPAPASTTDTSSDAPAPAPADAPAPSTDSGTTPPPAADSSTSSESSN
jgi:hypothetical protein